MSQRRSKSRKPADGDASRSAPIARLPAGTRPQANSSSPSSDRLTATKWAASALALLLVFCCLTTWLQFDFSNVMGYYSMFADALANGRLYLDISPDQVQLMDMIPYQGHYYLQWGPTPAVFHLAALLLGMELSDRIACILAGWISALLFLKIMLLLRARYFPGLPDWVCMISFWMFALGSPTAVVVLRPTIYNECIAVASVAVLAAFLVFLHFEEQPSLLGATLCGLAVTVAATTRITLSLYAAFLFLGLAVVLWQRRQSISSIAGHLGLYTLPMAAGIAIQLAYNYGRFGSYLSYFPEQTPDTARWLPVFRFGRIPENIRHYLLALPSVTNDFPWVAHEGWQPIVDVLRAESMSSMLLGTPILIFAFFAWRILRPRDAYPMALKLFLALALSSGLAVFAVMLMFHSASRRYMQDFVPVLLLVAFAGLAGLWRQGANWNRFKLLSLALLAYMAVFHIHLSFMHSFVHLPTDLNVVRAVAEFSPIVRRVLPGPNLDREEAIARNDLATLNLRQGRVNEAVEHLRKAAALMPDSELIRKNLDLAERLAQQ